MNFEHVEKTLNFFGVENYAIFGEPQTEEDVFKQIKIVIGKEVDETVIYEKNFENYPFTFSQFKEKLEQIKNDYEKKEYQKISRFRREAILDWIKEGALVLDAGCSQGQMGETIRKEKNTKVVGLDISDAAIREAKNRLDEAYVVDLEKDYDDY
jgi:2-polyprenyl-3-methyl-5-hydroxy-6-metoxy-1,4-benzoquinol methylase